MIATRGQRIALIAGLRTPFARQGTALRALTALELGARVVRALVARAGVPPAELGRIVYGQVVPSLTAPNLAREIVFEAGLRRDLDASTVTRACTTGYQAAIDVIHAIAAGDITAGIAGGADSTSDVPIAVPKNLATALMRLERARTLADRLTAFRGVGPRDLIPEPPALRERATGLTMGEHAERMAADDGISRADQDAYAHRSHTRAARAWAEGRFADQVIAIDVAGAAPLGRDNSVRAASALADYARLRPVVSPTGTITAGNASPLSDGASAAIFMREDRARALGLAPLAFVRATALTAHDPDDQMLMGPAYAIPRALARAGLTFADLDLVDLHEAFAAQILSVTRAIESRAWAAAHLGAAGPIGTIDWDRFNVAGGSIAIGHPFAATGLRQVTQLAHELRRRGGGLGVAAACAAGGLGAAIILEADG